MVRKGLILSGLAFSFNALALAPAANADTVDNWCTSYVSGGKGLHKITIRKDADKVKIHAVGTGFPDDIDWGESTAEVYLDETHRLPRFVARYSIGNNKALLVLSPNSGGSSPHEGGLIISDVYMQNSDGKPIRYVSQQFNAESKPAAL